ncbi:hypothetical protein BC828DRAFT_387200 [Blastocladiella britannica]|nr:hypothetical protein BC828DRAFT_387200 [Blastocladiella britannica]
MSQVFVLDSSDEEVASSAPSKRPRLDLEDLRVESLYSTAEEAAMALFGPGPSDFGGSAGSATGTALVTGSPSPAAAAANTPATPAADGPTRRPRNRRPLLSRRPPPPTSFTPTSAPVVSSITAARSSVPGDDKEDLFDLSNRHSSLVDDMTLSGTVPVMAIYMGEKIVTQIDLTEDDDAAPPKSLVSPVQDRKPTLSNPVSAPAASPVIIQTRLQETMPPATAPTTTRSSSDLVEVTEARKIKVELVLFGKDLAHFGKEMVTMMDTDDFSNVFQVAATGLHAPPTKVVVATSQGAPIMRTATPQLLKFELFRTLHGFPDRATLEKFRKRIKRDKAAAATAASQSQQRILAASQQSSARASPEPAAEESAAAKSGPPPPPPTTSTTASGSAAPAIRIQLQDANKHALKVRVARDKTVGMLLDTFCSKFELDRGRARLKNPDDETLDEESMIGDCEVEDDDMVSVVFPSKI